MAILPRENMGNDDSNYGTTVGHRETEAATKPVVIPYDS
jgi:hypothetical protein